MTWRRPPPRSGPDRQPGGRRARSGARPGPEPGGPRGPEPRWFRVRVTDTASGRPKVNVNIPMGLVNVGIKMGARFAPDMAGMDFSAIQTAIKQGMQGKIVEVDNEDEGEHLELFVE